jgi:hypothetical protein
MALSTYRPQRASRLGRSANQVAFQSFLDRDALREKRQRSRRITLIVSLLVHGLAILALVVYSVWRVDELWTPSVPVKVYSRKAAPPGALKPARWHTVRVAPAPSPR